MTPAEELLDLVSLVKAGSVKNVTAFGSMKLALPVPYVVIKAFPAVPDRREYQCRAHFEIGADKELDNYILNELPMLVRKRVNAFSQCYYQQANSYEGIGVDGGDNTLVAAISFYVPLITRGNGRSG